jgi:hypothetical protein
MGYWNDSAADAMDFEIPRPRDNVVQENTSAWDQHVMDIDYDVRTLNRLLSYKKLTFDRQPDLTSSLPSAGHELSNQTSLPTPRTRNNASSKRASYASLVLCAPRSRCRRVGLPVKVRGAGARDGSDSLATGAD